MAKHCVRENRVAKRRSSDHFRSWLVAFLVTCWIGVAGGQTSFNVTGESDYNQAAGTIATESSGTGNTVFTINIANSFPLTAPFTALTLSGSGNGILVINPASTLGFVGTGSTPQTIFSSTAGTVTIVNSGSASLGISNVGVAGTGGTAGLSGISGSRREPVAWAVRRCG